MKLAGKVALVTGGARGIGKSISEAFLKKGAKVCIADYDDKTGAQTADEFNGRFGENSASCQKVDVSNMSNFEDAVKATIDRFGRIDVIVNNAGTDNENNLNRLIAVNTGGVFNGTALGVKYMGKNGSNPGVVINISSVQGLIAVPFDAYYTGTKHAVVGLTRAIAQAEADSGVRFNCVCPCFVQTDMLEEAMKAMDEDTSSLINRFGVIPPSFVGDAVLLLSEDDTKNGCVMLASKYKGLSVVPMPDVAELLGERP